MSSEKSRVIAFILWLPPFGILGAHRFYLGQWGWGIFYIFTLGNFGLSWFFDLFRIYPLVSAYNLGELHEKKYAADALILWFSPFGILGAHRYYVGQWGFGLFYSLTGGNFAFSWLFDFCRIWSLVDDYNTSKLFTDRVNLHDAFILWLPPFGMLGAHRCYLRSYGFCVLYALTCGGFGLPWLCDIVRIPNMVERLNSDLEWVDGHIEKGLARPPAERCDRDKYDLVILWLPILGLLGAHRFYLRQYGWGFLYLFTCGLFGLGWLVDGLRLVILYHDYEVEYYAKIPPKLAVSETIIEEQIKTSVYADPPPPYPGHSVGPAPVGYSNPFSILFDQTGQGYLVQPINQAYIPTGYATTNQHLGSNPNFAQYGAATPMHYPVIQTQPVVSNPTSTQPFAGYTSY